MTMKKELKPFGFKDKIGYMFGDCANDFTFILCAMFLMKFYTDVMGVPAAVVGLMMLIAKVVDAITDVLMGQLCDRSAVTEKGKFAPWLRRMMGPVALASVLMYAVWFKNMPMGFKIFWMFFTYLLYGSVFYTSVNIPYGSMASALSPEPKDRTSLSTFRSIGATLAVMGIGVVLPMVVYYKDEATGNMLFSGEKMLAAAVVCSCIAVICYILCYSLTTERVKMTQVTEKFSFLGFWKTIISSRSLIGIVFAALLLLIVQLALTGMNNYIYPNYFRNRAAISLASLLSSLVLLALSAFIGKIAAAIGKKETSIAGAVIGAASMGTAYFIHTENIVVWFVFFLIGYMGLACFNLLCWAMITDVIDDMEIKNGVRNDGSIYAVYSFARKLGQAAASGLTGILLTLVGYTRETAFDPSVTKGIYNITTLIPAVSFIALALALAFIYPLGKKQVSENSKILHGGN